MRHVAETGNGLKVGLMGRTRLELSCMKGNANVDTCGRTQGDVVDDR